ncbi:E3 ubiquitin-protein ligase lubel-like [Uloborus diversus]|uniref:E3 ubiquitin-protein ligase lubel-like n=1 Tax=Uloborus diversus TaxID=327109 RepID=UPI002409962B|nr:E3 ubiquitin-protein ligase lubel-like [Uloborus diversus]
MYHRHPKRRFHLRKAADPGIPTPGARPVLPLKASHLTGDPSKMPLPPPRKKKPAKSFFDNFRRGSPSREGSPPLPKKEYSWTDRLGSIKKFMSNRPLPPLPNDEMQTNGQHSAEVKHDLSFIHKRVEEIPPQLPERSPRPQELGMERRDQTNGQIRNGFSDTSAPFNQTSGIPDGNPWMNNGVNNRNMHQQQFGTLNRNHPHPFMAPGGPPAQSHHPSSMMHPSSSATDLHAMDGMTAMPGMPPFPHYPMPPHYPYPMYPQQYPGYPGYFAGSFANLNQVPMDGDFSDQSDASMRHHPSRKHQFRKRAKRSQSVMMDRMAYPGQFFPYGPFPPGFGPWAGGTMPMEAPPSPASSVRSLSRTGRLSRRRKKGHTSDDDDFSGSSSPLSHPKSSSSEMRVDNRPSSGNKKAPLASSDEESEEEEQMQRKSSKRADPRNRRGSSPMVCQSPSVSNLEKDAEDSIKQKKKEHSETSLKEKIVTERRPSKESYSEISCEWECSHCTFLNPAGKRICQVCCKTCPEGSRKVSLRSPSPEKKQEVEEEAKEEATARKNQQDMASLNSALDEAEKEITRGLEELMKIKDDFARPPSVSKSPQLPTATDGGSSKPVYKSSGRMRTSILDKLNLSTASKKAIPFTETTPIATDSTSIATETEFPSHLDLNQNKSREVRGGSNSSSASESFNSPTAQSPVDLHKKDSSCQTKKDNGEDYLQRKHAEEDMYLDKPPPSRYGFGYADRMPSPGPYDRYLPVRPMQRSHSRASLFAGRINDSVPMDYGFGYSPMYRSVSRGSLSGEFSFA